LAAITIVTAGLAGNGFGQDQTKSIKAPEYARQRPAASGGAVAATLYVAPSKPVRVRVRKRKPAVSRVKPVPPRQTETARLGFTVWRVEKGSGGSQSKGLTERDASDGQRLGRIADEGVAVGDSVRIGIESLTHSGYLYVIDREKYADGTYGPPTLIYPTLRYRRGDNSVRPGEIVFLPGPGREIVVTSDAGRKQVAEELTVIVSPTRLITAAELQNEQIKLSPNQLLTWLQDWATQEVQIDQIDAAGAPLTRREEGAVADESKGLSERPLSPDDPLPQTMVEMKVRRGNPVITTFTLPIKKS
jgi:hypothetical protein